MKCSEIMKTDIITCRQDEAAREAAKVMRDHNVGFVPVVDSEGQAVGTITDRDLVVRLLANGQPGDTPLAQLMSRELVCCGPDDSLSECERRMESEHKGRILVCSDGNKPIGVISLSDIAHAEKAKRAGQVLKRITEREYRAWA